MPSHTFSENLNLYRYHWPKTRARDILFHGEIELTTNIIANVISMKYNDSVGIIYVYIIR